MSSFSSNRRRVLVRGTGLAMAAALVAAVLTGAAARAQQAEPAELTQARQLFDALDYEHAMPLLDRVITTLEPTGSRDPGSRKVLVAAYEMRARARFGTGNREGVISDFRSLLALDPSFTLGEGVSPRVVQLLDEVKAMTIGTLELHTQPGDVTATVDGASAPVVGGKVSLASGAHTVRIGRAGYKSVDQTVMISAGQSVPLSLTLDRVSSVLTVISSPPDVEVLVNGVSKGRTAAGALPASMAGLPAQLGVPPDQLSLPMLIGDVPGGTLQVELRRPCYASQVRQLPVQGMSDVTLDPVKLTRAVGGMAIDSEPAGATVWVDGESKGTAPVNLDSVCAGLHIVEFRGASGRAVERVSIDSGNRVTVRGRVRPAFALIAAPSGPDPRLAVESAFSRSTNIVLYAPPLESTAAALGREPVDDAWFGLAGDLAGTPAERRKRAENLAAAFDAQGIAWVKPSRPGSSDIQLALAVPGAANPDVLTVSLDDAASVQQAINRLDYPMVLMKASFGAALVDVLDVKGAVVLDVDAGQAAEKAGLKPGEVIQAVDGQSVSGVSDLEARLASHQAGERVALTVQGQGAGAAARPVSVTLGRVPVLLAGTDRYMPSNAIVAVLRSRLASTSDPEEQAAVQLNLGAALLRAGDARDARDILEKTTLPPGPGVSRGTVQYLLGEAAEDAGDRGAAALSYTAASQAEGRLSADGPLVKSLAARALERLK